MAGLRCNTVLLIDDNPIDNLINRKIIESNRFADHIQVFTSAKSALIFIQEKLNFEELLALNTQVVIFLDIRMPEMDGFQFLDEYKKINPEIQSICKIYMLSSTLDPLDKRRISQNKFVDKFFCKPLSNKFAEEINNGEM